MAAKPTGRMHDPDHWDQTAAHYEQTAHPFTVQFADDALAMLPVGPGKRVLDIATGTGALARGAARLGAEVLATDFSPAMVERAIAGGPPNLTGRPMNGEALDLADATFDAVFSIFGVVLFADWRSGLREMARVTRPGGHGVIATWREEGAATFLLLRQILRDLYPERPPVAAMPEGVTVLGEPELLVAELCAAGFREVRFEFRTHDYLLELPGLDTADKLFGMSPDWVALDVAQQAAVIAEVRRRAAGAAVLPIPSTALIAVATR